MQSFDKRLQRVQSHGSTEVIPLKCVAAGLTQNVELLLRLHAFGQHRHVVRLADRDDALNQFTRPGIALEVIDGETPVGRA